MLLFARSENICCGFPIKARSRASTVQKTRTGMGKRNERGKKEEKEIGRGGETHTNRYVETGENTVFV